ncbi:GH14061 [Drosophila grimshawi]|uniref:GH14061 n=1 Tax=Drosophila grimshawi TaxID=7222 RepID=B4JY95_DROGR|nr:GH14061 [Drosophila grimshawi]
MYKCGISVVSANRKDWTPAEDATFLRIWYSNLVALREGITRKDFHKDLVADFIDQGIDVASSKIQRKMQTFKRRYYK